MFDDQQQSNNGNLNKEINLLPEKMRSKYSPKQVVNGEQEETRYTTPQSVSTPKKYEKISWWQKLIASLGGKSKVKITTVANRNSKSTTPLQKLYAQDIRTDSKTNKNIKLFVPTSSQAEKTTSDNQLAQVDSAASDSFNSEKTKPLSVLEKIDQQLQRGLHLTDNSDDEKDQFGVNLIPEDMVAEVNEKKVLFTLSYAVIISLVILAFGYIVIQFIQLQEAKKIQKLQQEIQQAENEFISKSDDLKALIRYQQIYDNINLLLDSHIYWDKLFTFLEKNVANDVYFLSLTADKNGLVNINLVAKSYEALADQYQIFKQAPEVIAVNIDSASLAQDDMNSAPTSLSTLELNTDLANQTTSTATSTNSQMQDLRSLILNYYNKMPVNSQVNLKLNTNIFYREK